MATKSEETIVELDGREVRITSPDKVFFPERGETKLDLVRYYESVREPLMSTMGGRPVLLQRFSSLDFALYVHVADPAVLGKVKHRLHRRIQDAFLREGIEIPFPVLTLLVRPNECEPFTSSPGPNMTAKRVDPASRTPPEPLCRRMSASRGAFASRGG